MKKIVLMSLLSAFAILAFSGCGQEDTPPVDVEFSNHQIHVTNTSNKTIVITIEACNFETNESMKETVNIPAKKTKSFGEKGIRLSTNEKRIDKKLSKVNIFLN